MQQQSAAEGNCEPTQLLTPHFRFPEQSLSLSQSPSSAPQGFELEQHPQVSATDVPLQIHLGIIGLPEIVQFYNHLNYAWYDHEKFLLKLFNILECIIRFNLKLHNFIITSSMNIQLTKLFGTTMKIPSLNIFKTWFIVLP